MSWLLENGEEAVALPAPLCHLPGIASHCHPTSLSHSAAEVQTPGQPSSHPAVPVLLCSAQRDGCQQSCVLTMDLRNQTGVIKAELTPKLNRRNLGEFVLLRCSNLYPLPRIKKI